MNEETYDLLVIGGGINGAAVARDAVGRGFSVVLAEAGDFAGETSSASSKLIHGGLRYLEHFEFRLVHESLREREILLKNASGLVQPIRFLVPIRKHGPRPAWLVGLGLWLYQLLARSDLLEKAGSLTRSEEAAVPHLRTAQLSRIFHYPDCQVDDARLTLELILDARDKGAKVENYTSVTAIRPAAKGYRVSLDGPHGARDIHATHLVNASGTHVNDVLNLYCGSPPPECLGLRLVRGSHIVLPLGNFSKETAFTLSNRDGRVIFVIPWLGRFRLVGTTDERQDPNEPVVCTDEERDYLLSAYREFFNDEVSAKDVLWSFAGVRPLADDGDRNPSKVTRDYRLSEFRHAKESGTLLSVYGGKLTTHRALAERVVSRLQKLDGRSAKGGGKPWTAKAPLLRAGNNEIQAQGISDEIRARWSEKYGYRMAAYLDGIDDQVELSAEIVAGVPIVELGYAWTIEAARTAEDYVSRRTKLVLDLNDQEIDLIENWFRNERENEADI